MATDYWPSEKGLIVPGFEIGFCYCDGTIAEGQCVKMGTPGAGKFAVTTAAASGDGIGVALKVGGAAKYIPVCFYGVCKMDAYSSTAITAGDFVINSAESGVLTFPDDKSGIGNLKLLGGNSYVLGMALQTSAADGDNILVLVGKCL
jgi:hypothetical protein